MCLFATCSVVGKCHICCEISWTRPLTPGLPPVESVQKSPVVVRPKDSAAPLSWRDTGAAMEESRSSFQEEMAFNDQAVYSYQQISCLDSVVRYTEED